MKKANWIGILTVFLAGCRSMQPIDGLTVSKLTPYVPSEKNIALLDESTPDLKIEIPVVPTADTVIHVVTFGETISSIALQYGFTIEAVRGANPDVNPNMLIVGDELHIPINEPFSNIAFGPEMGKHVRFSDQNCVPSRDTGILCAVMVENLGENDLENMVVAFSFLDPDGNLIETRYAPTMMRFLPAGSIIPSVIFLNVKPANFVKAIPSLFSAQVVDIDTKLYLPVVIEEETRLLNRTDATISGKMRVESGQDVERANIWIGAAAFDAGGALIGVRRIDSEVVTNESFGFTLTVYAAESSIDRVELFAEAF